jgi:hypothetical protein
MRQRAGIEDRCVVARRLFDALCSKYPDNTLRWSYHAMDRTACCLRLTSPP